jgi:hypothetical protein
MTVSAAAASFMASPRPNNEQADQICPEVYSGCSGVWLPPPKYRNNEACNQDNHLDADLYPVLDRRGISISNPTLR